MRAKRDTCSMKNKQEGIKKPVLPVYDMIIFHFRSNCIGNTTATALSISL
jgi:hypothetical protein